MKKILLPALMAATVFASCSKDDNNTTPNLDFENAKTGAITDFVGKVALPGYSELQVKANALNAAVVALNASTTDANLTTAKNAWKDLRTTWERTEGFLFGPVEDNEYDPDTDTWPVNFNDMDALLATTTPLSTVDNIEALTDRSLKGYHPIEYMLWGQNGNKTTTQFTARQKEYLTGLSLHLKKQCESMYNDWAPAGGNFADKFLKAGNGSTVFVKKQDAFLAVYQGLTDICGEVGDGKMKEPYDAEAVSAGSGAQLVESPFSGNSAIDFKNNIIGAYNTYMGKFNDDGVGLQDVVKARNSALNAEIVTKFDAAINSFNNITLPYETAIKVTGGQRQQCLATMTAINDLANTLDTKLKPFILAQITD